MSPIHLTDRKVVEVSGEEADHFLSNLLTTNPPDAEGQSVWWALLSPQGKIAAEGLMGWNGSAILLDVHDSVISAFEKKLRMYKLRAKVNAAMRNDLSVGWSPHAVAGDQNVFHADPRGGGFGFRVIAPTEAAEGWSKERSTYEAERIARGLAFLGSEFAADEQFPHDLAMELNSGVNFKKGCYVGQEVVSRMQHRSTARKRPVIVRGAANPELADVMLGERVIGRAGPAHDGKAIAIVRIDKVSNPEAATINGQTVSLALPSWASYAFSDSSD
ncbi:MAG: folate-binding protein YgfZ [Hyphomicrobiaceae bacterium]|nr:folate-binding protein YgfZ [Hyphomicrobiaceae bacterium]MCC0023084.1 folate-binding protein YgfZ [Hyphomicrobiaceae bacterium]